MFNPDGVIGAAAWACPTDVTTSSEPNKMAVRDDTRIQPRGRADKFRKHSADAAFIDLPSLWGSLTDLRVTAEHPRSQQNPSLLCQSVLELHFVLLKKQ